MVWGLGSIFGSGGKTSSSSSQPNSSATNPSTTSQQQSPALQTPKIQQLPSTPPTTTTTTAITTSPSENYWTSARSRKQLTLFGAGALFLLISTRITHRALARKHTQMLPRFYQPSNAPPSVAVNGPIEAVEALAVASINVFSAALLVGGGLLWSFDICTVDDLRRKIRGGMGIDGSGRSERDVEEEFEEWIAATLERKKRKEEGVAGLEEVRREWRNERGRER